MPSRRQLLWLALALLPVSALAAEDASLCPACRRKVHSTDLIKGAGKQWHQGCFRCQAPGCNISLTLKNHFAHEGQIYCKAHVPKTKAVVANPDPMTAPAKKPPTPTSK